MRTRKIAALGTTVEERSARAACGGATVEDETEAVAAVTGARSAALLDGTDDVDTPERTSCFE